MIVPAGVQDLADRLHAATDHRPLVEQVGQRWRITMENDRVRMVVEYKAYSRGRTTWRGSTLEIDGRRVPLANGFNHFVSIFLDRERAVAEPDPPLPGCDPEGLPPLVRQTVAVLEARGRGCRVGFDGTHWAVDVEGVNASGEPYWLRYPFERVEGTVVGCRIRLIVAGVDRSGEVRDGFEQAVALLGTLGGRSGTGPGVTGPVRSVAPGAGRSSQHVRRDSVIRT